MRNRTLKSTIIGGLAVSETTEGSAVELTINGHTTALTREELRKLHETGEEYFTKNIVLICEACGNELTGTADINDTTATLKIAPCQACAGKEHITHEDTKRVH